MQSQKTNKTPPPKTLLLLSDIFSTTKNTYSQNVWTSSTWIYLFTVIGLLNLEYNFWCLISELSAENSFCWTDFLTWDVMKELLLTDALSYKMQCLLKCHHLLYVLRTVTFFWTASFTVFVVCACLKTFGEKKEGERHICTKEQMWWDCTGDFCLKILFL